MGFRNMQEKLENILSSLKIIGDKKQFAVFE